MIPLIILQLTEQIPTEAVEKVTNLISKEGASTVGLAIVIVCFLIMFLSMIKRNNLSEATMKQQLDVIQKMGSNIDRISVILDEHTKVLNTLVNGITEEISSNQLDEISDLLFSKSIAEVLDYIDQIILENHIQDRARIELKVKNICSNLYSLTRERAVNFKYKGQPLSFFLNSVWKEEVGDIVIRSIYAEEGYNRRITKTDITLAFDKIKSNFIEIVTKTVGGK